MHAGKKATCRLRWYGSSVCVFITAGPSTKLFALGGGGVYGRTCATRDDEPRPVWTRLPITHFVCVCLLLQDLVQSCVRGEGGDFGRHVLRETTSRGLCGLVCLSRTSERGGEGDCVKEGGGGKGKCERERALERLRCYSLDIEVDPQRCRFGNRKSDFALQALVECRALEPK
jgi:hypothetical protein